MTGEQCRIVVEDMYPRQQRHGNEEDGGHPLHLEPDNYHDTPRTEAEPIRCEDMQRLEDEFRDLRRSSGPEAGNLNWVSAPFSRWMTILDSWTILGEDDGQRAALLSRDDMAALAIGMNESLPIRDAMIVSLVTGKRCDEATMVAIAARPHTDRVRKTMSRLLDEAFHEADTVPDFERCGRGMAMLADIGKSVPERWRVQPLAALAYVSWWIDDDRAALRAIECLSINAECRLALIVLSMIEHGVHPAWCVR